MCHSVRESKCSSIFLNNGGYLGPCSGGIIYGLLPDVTLGTFHFVSVDLVTGVPTVLFNFTASGVSTGSSTFDPINKKYYFRGGGGGSTQHFVVDVASNSITINATTDDVIDYEFYSCEELPIICPSCKKGKTKREGKFEIDETSVSNSPNPFSEKTTFNYAVKSDGTVNLEIYDLTGRIVAKPILQQYQTSGEYQLDWSVGDIPEGVYFYRLNTPTEQVNGKLMIIK